MDRIAGSHSLMKIARFPVRFWIIALALAWAFDLLFYAKAPGISFPIWMVLILVGICLLAVWEKVRPAWPNLALMVACLAMALVTFARAELMTRFVNFAGSMTLLGLLLATLRTGNWLHFHLVDQLMALLRLLWDGFTRPPGIWRQAFTRGSEEGNETTWKMVRKPLLAVVRGLLLALPVVLVLGVLLASADPIFGDWTKSLAKLLNLSLWFEYLFRLFYILIFTYLFVGYLANGILPAREEGKPDPNKAWMKPFLGWIEAMVVLLSVDILFAIFVAIQFRYFFGGQANINVAGYTYSEYARRGFSELVVVAVLSLGLYLSLGLVTHQETIRKRRIFSGLAIGLLGLVVIILVSAFQRLTLYEQAYGFTQLRTYTHVFIVWLAALLGAIILLEILQQRGRFALALVLACLGFSLTLGFLNVDGFIARANVGRALQGKELDGHYLDGLSADAVPTLVRAFDDPALPAVAHEQLGAGLACRTFKLADEKTSAWPSFHLAEAQSRRLLVENQEQWKDYSVRVSDLNGRYVQLGNQVYRCDPAPYTRMD